MRLQVTRPGSDGSSSATTGRRSPNAPSTESPRSRRRVPSEVTVVSVAEPIYPQPCRTRATPIRRRRRRTAVSSRGDTKLAGSRNRLCDSSSRRVSPSTRLSRRQRETGARSDRGRLAAPRHCAAPTVRLGQRRDCRRGAVRRARRQVDGVRIARGRTARDSRQLRLARVCVAIGVNRLGQLEDLTREIEQLLVLPVLFLDGLPLLVGDRLTLRVGPVLADHHEGREEDRLERDDHRQQAVRVVLDAESDPAAEPGDVDVDEPHRAGERGDAVGDPVLDALRPLLGMPGERRVRLGARAWVAVAHALAGAASRRVARRGRRFARRRVHHQRRRTSRRARSPEPDRCLHLLSPHLSVADSSSAFCSSSSRAAAMRFRCSCQASRAAARA